MTVCFFNFFTRYAEALNLPVEPWALEGPMTWPAVGRPRTPVKARIALLADDEITAAAAALRPVEGSGGPAGAEQPRPRAWPTRSARCCACRASRRPGARSAPAFREKATVARDIQLQVSFAVSTANECRYCTLHQVQGLRGLGVDPVKLAGDAEGRLGADAARAGGGEVRAQADRPAVGHERRRLRRGEEGVRRRRRARGRCCRPATSPS